MTQRTHPVVGREAELGILRTFLSGLPVGPASMEFHGLAGMGKTILWRRGLMEAQGLSYTVLDARPSSAETPLSFAGLGDLLGRVLDQVGPHIPPPQAEALDVALLRAPTRGTAPDPRSVAVGTLSAVRWLAARTPVVIAVDDRQWLDEATGEVVEFVRRRLVAEPVGFLETRRAQTSQGPRVEGNPAEAVTTVEVGPLSPGALHELMRQRFGQAFPRPTLMRIHQTSGGNPFYALEIARLLLDRGQGVEPSRSLPVPESLLGVLDERLRRLPGPVRRVLEAVAVLSDPTVELLEGAATSPGRAFERLREAMRADVVELDGDRVRFTHPLLGEAVLSTVGPSQRRSLHRRMAEVVPRTEERARHLALAATGHDADVAHLLEEAAAEARARGATVTAAQLSSQSATLTPPREVDTVARRTLAAAMFWADAGEEGYARTLLASLGGVSMSGQMRRDFLLARARLVEDRQAVLDLSTQTLAEGGDDLRARTRAFMGIAYTKVNLADFSGAAEDARIAAEAAASSGDDKLHVEALSMAGRTRSDLEEPRGMDLLRRALELEGKVGPIDPYEGPGTWIAMRHVWADELDLGRPLLERQYERSVELGDDLNRKWLCHLIVELECRAGNLSLARRYAETGLELAEQSGNMHGLAALYFARALVEAHTGDAAASANFAEWAIEAARSVHTEIFGLKARAAAGFLALSVGEYRGAIRHLEIILDRVAAGGQGDWAWRRVYPFVPDLIESLISVGRREDAERLIDRLERRGTEHGLPGDLAAAARCRGLLAAARGEVDRALDHLERAQDLHRQRPVPLERGRTLLALGATQRQGKRKRQARESLQAALDVFEGMGAALWAAKAREELGRIGGRAASGLELTGSERRVAELAAGGMTNREVAEALFLSEHTVESHLSSAYRKLGVRSRTELASKLGP